jgi:hypothetical protein
MIQIYIKSLYCNDLNKYDLNTYDISPYDSVFSLKMRLNERLKEDMNEYYLIYAGKTLEDNRCLKAYNIENGSTIYLEKELRGGNILKIQYLMMIALVVIIMLFFVYLITGFLPVVANIFYFLVKITIDKLIGVFQWIWSLIQEEKATISDFSLQGTGKFSLDKITQQYKNQALKKIEVEGEAKADSYNFLNILYDGFFFLLKIGFTFTFVFTASAGLILPIFWYRTEGDMCRSMNLSYYVGLVVTVIYFIFYGLFLNTVDALVSAYFFSSSFFPLFMKAVPDALLATIKDAWDESKLLPFYAIPIVGQVLLGYHEAIQVALIYLKSFLDQQSQYDCDGGEREENIKKVFAGLVYKNKKDDKGGYVSDVSKAQLGDNFIISMVREVIKDFKLNSLVRLMNISFNENTQNELKFSQIPWYKKIFTSEYWDWYSSGAAKGLICNLLGFGVVTREFIDDMNGPLGVANMIKTGNIAGVFTAIAYFIILILAFFLSGMFGIKIKPEGT